MVPTFISLSNQRYRRQPGPDQATGLSCGDSASSDCNKSLDSFRNRASYFGDHIDPWGTLQTNAVLVLPIVIGLQFILTLSLAYILGTFQVTFRDTQYLLGVALQLLFFLTPIFYDAKAIPQQYQSLYHINPMVHLIEAYRAILVQGELPNAHSLLFLGLLDISLLSGGYFIFKRASYHFVEEL